jgi:maleylpyruvate isomerase
VRIALAYKGLEYSYEPVHLLKDGGEQRTASYAAINPLRQVPSLEWEEGGRRRRLSQSLAIIEWLEETHPEPALLPADPFLRAKARQLAEMVNSGIQPLQNLSTAQRVEQIGLDKKTWTWEWLVRGLAALEAATAEVAGRYSVGDSVTMADLCLVPQLYSARRFEIELGAYPTLLRVEAACRELPAFEESRPERQPDAA